MAVGKRLSRAEQREASRSAVIKAALSEFARVGYEGASLNEIASLSGVSKPNIVYYFSSKENLWRESVANLFDRVADDFAAELEALSGEPSLNDLIAMYTGIASKHPAYVLIPLIEGVSESWRTRWLADNYLSTHTRQFRERTSQLVQQGGVIDVDSVHLQNLITGGAQLYIALAPLWEHVLGVDTRSPKFLKGYASTLTNLLSH